MRAIIRLLPLAFLAGCAGTSTTPPNYTAIVGMIQTDWPQLKNLASIYTIANPAAAPGIAKIEAAGDTLVAALSATSAPTSIQAALANAGALLTALPPGVVSAQTKADITLGIALLSGATGLLGGL